MDDLISIVTPVYNAEKYLEKTILSVLSQTYKKWELLLINDFSTDNSYELIEKYSQLDERIKCINNLKNEGAAFSRNRGIEISRGEYVAFLDSDDLWDNRKLESQIDFMKKNNLEICHSDYNFIDDDDNFIKIIRTAKKITYQSLLKENQIRTSFLMIKKLALIDIKFPNVKHEDFAFFLNVLKKNGIYSLKNNMIGGGYRVSTNSLSANKLKSAKWTWEIYRSFLKFNVLKSSYYFLFYAFRGLKKYKK